MARYARIDVANDNNKYRFYVYCWCYPDGRPFYVGKGNGRRDTQPKHNTIFSRIVAKIRREGGEPVVVRWQDGLCEGDAFLLEKSYIKLLGRRDTGTGVLANMTDGGDGVSGLVFTDESRSKLSASLTEYCKNPSVRDKKSSDNKRRYKDPAERRRTSLASRMAGPGSDNKTGFKGVSQLGEKWRAAINDDGRQKHLGLFDSPRTAALAYDYAARTLWGSENCYLNFPDEVIDHGQIEKINLALDASISRGDRSSITARMAPAHSDSLSGIKGVSARGGKWCARIRVDGRLLELGNFLNKEDAGKAYDKAAIDAWGLGNCYLNFPDAAA